MSVRDLYDIADSRFPAIIRDLDNMQLLDDDRNILFYLELYELVSRQEIIDNLNQDNMNFTSCLEEVTPEEIEKDMYHLRNKDCYLKSLKMNTIEIVKDYYDLDNEKVPDVYFSDYNIELKYVTPLNYELLRTRNKNYVSDFYDPILYCKRIIYDAIENHASDVHFTNSQNRNDYSSILLDDYDGELNRSYNFRVAYRLLNDYKIISRFRMTKEINDSLIMTLIKDKTDGQVEDLLSSHGVKASWLNPLYDGSVDLRVTCSRTRGGYTCVIRISKKEFSEKTVADLGFDEESTEDIIDMSEASSGLTIIGGPVRSGKNTTMIGMVNIINKKETKIIELSSPIETIMDHEQYDYHSSREELLGYVELSKKQDVNVVLLNEIPDKGIGDGVLDLVNSSMEVLTTFHINRIWHAPYKLLDYFGSHYKDLITQMNGIITQKMFVPLCPKCKTEAMHRNFRRPVLKEMDRFGIKTFYESKGCTHCNGTGRENRVQPLVEVLLFTDEIKSKLLRCKEVWDMEDVIKNEVLKGERSLEYKIRDCILDGFLSPEDFMKLH